MLNVSKVYVSSFKAYKNILDNCLTRNRENKSVA